MSTPYFLFRFLTIFLCLVENQHFFTFYRIVLIKYKNKDKEDDI